MKNIAEKILLLIPTCFLTVRSEHLEIIIGIVALFLIDTFLGIWASLKYKIYRSNSMQRAVGKFTKYSIAMFNAWILSVIYPIMFSWVFMIVGAFIMVTEAMSNMEKLALLGFKVPSWIMAKINDQYNQLGTDPNMPAKIMNDRDYKNNN
jgi:phage-related holin